MFKAPDEGNYRSCRRDAPQEEQAFDIVDEVRHFGLGSARLQTPS
jgi:hypothetical protein